MGQKIVGGMWCDYCQRPVAGQKPTSRARNTVAGLTAPLTSGLSLLGAKINKVYCPTCGQLVRPATPQDFGAPAPQAAPPKAYPAASARATKKLKQRAEPDRKRKSTRLYCAEPGCDQRVTSELRARYCKRHQPG